MPPLSSACPAAVLRVTDETAVPAAPIPVNPACFAPLTRIDNPHFHGQLLIKMRGQGPSAVAATPPQRTPTPSAEQPSTAVAATTAPTITSTPAAAAGGCRCRTACGAGEQGCGAVCGCDAAANGCAGCGCAAAYFSSHPSVQLDVSIQGRFVHATTSVLWMGAELGGAAPFTLQLPWLKRGLIKLIANLISTAIPNVHWTLGDADKGEYPAIAFPLVKAMDRIHCTPLTDPQRADAAQPARDAQDAAAAAAAASPSPPPLGWQDFPPSLPSFCRSSLSLHAAFDPSCLYSFSFFSQNLDLLRWKAVHLPGISEVDLHGLWSDHPLRLVCYELHDSRGPHSHHNRNTYFDIQMQHHTQHQPHAPLQQEGGG